MKKLFIVLALIGYSVSIQAQSKKELVELGDAAYKNENFGSAVYFYKRVVQHIPGKDDLLFPYDIGSTSRVKKNKDSTTVVDAGDTKKIYVIHRLAESYRQLKDYQNSEIWYKIATENPSPQFPHATYYYALTLMNNEKYEEAEKILEAFIQSSEDEQMKKMAEVKMISCAFARNPENIKKDVNIYKMDSSFNGGNASFGINYFTDESVIFANAKSGNITVDPKKDDGRFSTDLYISSQRDSASWDMPQHFAAPVNSPLNEGACVLSIDRSTFYFTRWNPENKNECHIYVSKRFNKRWMEPLKLDLNIEGYITKQPMLNLDETKLFFTSNRPGGQGGFDIWYCPIDADGVIGDPVNLGPVINTIEDEVTPYYHLQTSTLYFASSGHRGFGGFDIFNTQFNEDEGFWSTPINAGAPINSSKDDYNYILDRSQRQGFYVSNRDNCVDCDSTADIKSHCDKIYSFTRGEIIVDIQGYVYNMETDEPIAGAIVEFKDVNAEWEPIVLITDENGFYSLPLQVGMEIFMKAKKTKFFADAASVTTTGIIETTHLQQDFYLRPIPTGEIEIPGIEYDFDKATLRPKSKEILDQLYDFLILNSDLTVEIKAHTDCRGNDLYNLKLSKERAKSCVDYLISKGIAKERLIPQGFGETEPLFKCEEIEAETDETKRDALHQRNRRTAFRVVKQD